MHPGAVCVCVCVCLCLCLCLCVSVCLCVCVSHSAMSKSLPLHRLEHPRLLFPWNFPGKNTGVGSHSLLQGISQPRDWTLISCVSCIDRLIPHHCATWGTHMYNIGGKKHTYCFKWDVGIKWDDTWCPHLRHPQWLLLLLLSLFLLVNHTFRIFMIIIIISGINNNVKDSIFFLMENLAEIQRCTHWVLFSLVIRFLWNEDVDRLKL